MVREDKVKVVKDLEDLFKSANALVLAEYRGLTVTQQTKLRRELKNAGASFNVVKMSLAKRAAENIGLDSLNDYFSGASTGCDCFQVESIVFLLIQAHQRIY